MPRLRAPDLRLTSAQKATLEAIVRKPTSPQQLVLRARIILEAGAGVGIREIARRLGVNREMVKRWRRRWLALEEVADVASRLADAPRPGAPAVYTAQHICEIIALACEKPSAKGLPLSHWTQQALADEAVKAGIVDSISQRSVGRFLKRSGLETASDTGLAGHGER